METQPFALAPCRLILFAAGWFVPLTRREEWREEWWAEAWYRWNALGQQGAFGGWEALQLYWDCLGAFWDGWAYFTQETARWDDWKTRLRSPSFCLTLLAAMLAVLAGVSGLFPATRTILADLPFSNGQRLALVTRAGRLEGSRSGMPRALANLWLKDSKLLEAMAACSVVHTANGSLDKANFRASSLALTANFFDVVGQPVSPNIRHALASGGPVAFISFEFWRQQLNGAPGIAGRRLRLGHRDLVIEGVLPQSFWFLSPSIQIYELNSQTLHDEATLVIRARPDATAGQLEAELMRIADQNDSPFARTAPRVLFLSESVRTPIWLFSSSLVIALVLIIVGKGSGLIRHDGVVRYLPRRNFRWWLFLLSKTALALCFLFTTGIEMIVGRGHQSSAEALGGPALLWFYTAGCSAVLFATIVDQQSRCRVCLRCLTFPIRIGSPGCLFLNWSGTELLCPEGHGMLYVPHHVSCWDDAERWIAMEI